MAQGGSPGSGGSGWTQGGAQPKVQPGPAGLVYADLPNRVIAYIIDAIILGIVNIIVFAILSGIGLSIVTINVTGVSTNYFASLIYAVIGLAISGGYFWYTWTKMRATIGMKVLGMQIGDAGDGKTLTNDQAIRRWIALSSFSIAQALNPIGGIGTIIGLIAFIYVLYLIYTTYKSPTKQGFRRHLRLHDGGQGDEHRLGVRGPRGPESTRRRPVEGASFVVLRQDAGSVEPANVPADPAGRGARVRVDLEKAGATVGCAIEAVEGCAAANSPAGARPAGEGTRGPHGSGHHRVRFLSGHTIRIVANGPACPHQRS